MRFEDAASESTVFVVPENWLARNVIESANGMAKLSPNRCIRSAGAPAALRQYEHSVLFPTPRRVLAFGLANVIHSALASAGERSGTTNTMLSEAASSKRIESHLARDNKYVWRFDKSLNTFGTAHVMVSALRSQLPRRKTVV